MFLGFTFIATVSHMPISHRRYVSWEQVKDGSDSGTLVVDCTHASLLTISHHKGQRNPPGSSDCSTGLVLDALAATGSEAQAVTPWLAKPRISVNHFDADAVLSMWAFIHRDVALQHSALLRHTARIGDLREAGLGGSAEALLARQWDGVSSEATVLHALQLSCWINTVERTRFTPPYIDKDADAKHRFFLDNLAAALTPQGILGLREVGSPSPRNGCRAHFWHGNGGLRALPPSSRESQVLSIRRAPAAYKLNAAHLMLLCFLAAAGVGGGV